MKRYTCRNVLGGMLAGAASLSVLDTKAHAADANLAAVDPKDHIKITKLETFPVNKTRSVFLKVYTDAGIVGPGELNWVHGIAVDSQGNIYATDIIGQRAQKFVRHT